MTPGQLILVRHAQTDGNRLYHVGRKDIPLNDTGRQQAEELGESLSAQQIDRIFSSPLQRARQTARPIAERHGLEVETAPELLEIDFGTLEGAPKGMQPFKLRTQYLDVAMPGGESLRDVWHRLVPLRRSIIDEMKRGRTVCAVGHYWSNRVLAAQFSDCDLETLRGIAGYKPANATATIICLPADCSTNASGSRARDTT